jgi:hypothetical protein
MSLLNNKMKTERFTIKLQDVKSRQRFAPAQKLISSKKRYKRTTKHPQKWD